MNLQPIHPPLAIGQRVKCSRCRRMVGESEQAVADSDSPWTYYCAPCVEEIETVSAMVEMKRIMQETANRRGE